MTAPSIIDISRPLHSQLPVWPGDQPFHLNTVTDAAYGLAIQTSDLAMSLHLGSHIDAASHLYSSKGKIDEIDLSRLIGPALVLDLRGRSEVTADDLRLAVPNEDWPLRLLLRTDNSFTPYSVDNFVALDHSAAEILVSHNVTLVGIDGPSIDRPKAHDLPAHRILLDTGVIVVEGLALSSAAPGEYELICLPLPLLDAEAAPIRAVLRPLGRNDTKDDIK